MSAPRQDPDDGPVVRDRRRLDPETGEVREAGEAREPAPAGGGPDTPADAGASTDHGTPAEAGAGADAETPAASISAADAAKAEAAERLNDLKRLQAEYVNYRKRVDRDRAAVRDNAVAAVLGDMLGILDDIGRARDHGDLTGGFRSVGESIEAVTQKLGLVKYGEVGDEFDPIVHEALMHEYSDEVSTPTCTKILMPGYRHGEKVLRPARVAVAEPTEALPDVEPANLVDVEPANGEDAEQEGTGPGSAEPGSAEPDNAASSDQE